MSNFELKSVKYVTIEVNLILKTITFSTPLLLVYLTEFVLARNFSIEK